MDTAEQGPVGDTVTVMHREPHLHSPHPTPHPHLEENPPGVRVLGGGPLTEAVGRHQASPGWSRWAQLSLAGRREGPGSL